MVGAKAMAWIFAAIAFIAVVGLLAVSLSGPNPERHQEQHQAKPSDQNAPAKPDAHEDTQKQAQCRPEDNKQRNYWERFVCYVEARDKFFTAFGTLVIAGFTVCLAFATIFLYLATRGLVEGADANAEKQLRPYVFLSGARIADALGTPKITIRIKNFGQTPAYNASFWSEGILREYPLTSKLTRLRSKNSPSLDIGPTGAMDTTIDWAGPITEPDKAALISKTKAIYIFGRVEYRDTFGHSWFTEFQFMEGGEYPFRPEGGELPHTAEGNKAT